jgi:hypothetical protein
VAGGDDVKDRDFRFHEQWLGLAQPVEGLVFSVPVLADAQIAPEIRPDLTPAFEAYLDTTGAPRIHDLRAFFAGFLGYEKPGMLVPRDALPAALSFYAAEGGQEIRPSFALVRGPFAAGEDPFAVFDVPAAPATPVAAQASSPWFALAWDLTEQGPDIDLDEPEATTGPWRYSPTAKLERLLRHVGIPIGFLFNGRNLRLVYAPPGESSAHLTFRVEHLSSTDGRPLLAALDLVLHARRAYGASPEHTLEGLLAESRRRQADVTEELARQVFEAVEILVAGFEAAAARDIRGSEVDWLRQAIEEEGDHFYQGVLTIVLRLVFLLYSEDQGLLPVEHPTYAEHLSLSGLYQRLSHDAGVHPESMHHRFGAYGQLNALFRAVFFGVKHGTLDLPPRRGRLFDPHAYAFLEGGLPGWTAAVGDPDARAAARMPSIDDGTVHRVLHRLVVFKGQRLSYRTLDVEQIGSVYESLMGYHVLRLTSAAVRLGKFNVWIESGAVRALTPTDRARYFKETCGLSPAASQAIEKGLKDAKDGGAALEVLAANAGKKGDAMRNRAPAGRLVLQPGAERRRTASHYTPRALTEKVVRRTLEPLLACLGEERTPEQILMLKICDPAMGSGAFLVETCRELASEIVAAWTRRGELARIVEAHGDAHLHARRLVAQQSLYGVDKNAAAVELAKLSLWLVTLSKELPFTFVDHALRHGDSLVGLNFKQIEAFHWLPPGQVETCRVLLREALDQAVELRQQILALADTEDAASQSEKRRLFDFSQQAIDRVRLVADVCVGAFFAETKDAAREKERKRRLGMVEKWLILDARAADSSRSEEQRATDTDAAANARGELDVMATEIRERVTPFHWWIEFPEVFFEERPDPLARGAVTGAALMEGVVGNPPFGGKNNIIEANVDGYLEWLKVASPGAHGNSDLSAHFYRRAAMLIGQHGTFGLIATKTIAQGDTRATGLAPLLKDGWDFYDATDSMPWLGAAAVTVSLVHGAHGLARGRVTTRLNGADVPVINSRLRPTPERPDPTPLRANADLAYVGSYVLGIGFTLTRAERDRLVEKDTRNGNRIFPYLNGLEINTSPTQAFDRYVIAFGQMSLEEAERWPDLIRIVREKVKPDRDRDKREPRRKYWWRFGETTPALYAALASLERCLVTAISSKHRTFAWQPTDRILDQTLIVFPLDGAHTFCLLQSRVHEVWSVELSATIKEDQRYNPSRAFATFPFPGAARDGHLDGTGQALYDARARFMVEVNQGLTKTYNALKDAACDDARILDLRRLHEAMDRAVLDAYGWTDIEVPPYCPQSDADRAAVQAFDDEVIDRLYVLNAERAREEHRLGAARKSVATAPSLSRDSPLEADATAKKEARLREVFQ